MANRIVLNETSYFGSGSIEVLPGEIQRRGFKKAFLVTDKDLVKCGVVGTVTNMLDGAGIPYHVYDNVKQNPTVENVQTGVEVYKKSDVDFVLAVGGGSAIDTAKAIAIIINNPEFADVVSLEGVADTKNRSVPIIALPTTAGTAAEVTINYVITDTVAKKKMVCVDANDIPVLSIVDAKLMASLPKSTTAATGMDALTHAIEGYITKGAWAMSDMFEIAAVELIAKHLYKAVHEPQDMEAREGMALGQYIAGMGFSNVGLGIVHSMAHTLGAFYDTPHGVANALLLPYVMEYNMPAAKYKYRAIAKAMGVPGTGSMSDDKAAAAAVEAVEKLARSVEIPQTLREIGAKEEDLSKLAAFALADVCTPGNPRDTTEAEILEIFHKAF